MKTRALLPILVVLGIGSLQIVGYLLNFQSLRALGQVTAASPLPLVFSHFRGLETFSPRFDVIVTSKHGEVRAIGITPAEYAKLDGPYNRRNVYGVAFAFGAVLSEPKEHAMVQSVLRYGFCPGGPIRDILENEGAIPSDAHLAIRITPKDTESIIIPVDCPL